MDLTQHMEKQWDTPHADAVRLLCRTALAVFAITVGIGLVNGQQVIQLSRATLLTHLHTGTLGWITLSVAAAAIWLFTAGRSATDRERAAVHTLARGVALALVCFPLAFFLFYPSGVMANGALLGVFGTFALVAVLWLFGWVVQQRRHVYWSVARLALLGALINLAIGSLLGLLVVASIAGMVLPEANFRGAHPGMMTAGFLVPIAMALVEWQLKGGAAARRSRWGVVQIGLLIVAGWLGVIGILFDVGPLLPLMLVCQIVGVLIFAVRLAGPVTRVRWLAPTAERFAAMGAVAVVLDVALMVYVVANYAPDIGAAPRGLLNGLGHLEFVGMMTNLHFAVLVAATQVRRGEVWPWVEDVLFWGFNAGWIGFVAGLLAGTTWTTPVFTSILGFSILVGITAFALRLRGARVVALAPVPA
jgi:hypothetical protein